MEDIQTRLLEKYKQFKGITDDKSDGVFKFAVETAVYGVLEYCNLEMTEWPMQLDNTVVLMVDDFVDERNVNKTQEEIHADAIVSVKEGDVTVTRETKTERIAGMAKSGSFLTNYRRTLNKYRKLRR